MALVIPVTPKHEPPDFETKVRKRGLAYLEKRGIDLTKPLPPGVKIHPYWRSCLTDLHREYDGVCAYLGVYFERLLGSATVDHFIAKSRLAGRAYEWNN